MASGAIYWSTVARATPILREKVIDERGDILELVVWRVPATAKQPAGVRYRLAFVRQGEAKPAVLYDSHPPKGDHRHVEGVEERYDFVNVERLLSDFMVDVRRVTGVDSWPGR